MFKTKYDQWFESQPKWTQEWMKKQAVWNDADMFKAGFIGVFVGIILGVLWAI